MALPKIKHPLFELELPSDGRKVKYRPFSAAEQKILLVAKESQDLDQIVLATKQVITNCVQDIDADLLPEIDVEFLFLNIRSKSVNNIIELPITDPDTKENITLRIKLDEVKVVRNPAHNKTIRLNDSMAIEMRYPTMDEVKLLVHAIQNNRKAGILDAMFACIATIESDGVVYETSDYTREELIEFADGLDEAQLEELQQFFDTKPSLRYEKTYVNKEGKKQTFVIQGLEAFFI